MGPKKAGFALDLVPGESFLVGLVDKWRVNAYRLGGVSWWLGGVALCVIGMTLLGSGADVALAYTESISTSGTVEVDVSAAGNGANVGTDNIVVNSTCPLGYTLSIAGPSDANLYKSGDSTNNAHAIVPSAGTSAHPLPIIGDNGSGTSYLNTWGYTTESNTTFNSNFIGLTNTMNTLTTSNSASATGGDMVDVHYGVSVDSSLEPGLYTMASNGAVTYYLIPNANCFSFNIQYDGNNASAGSMGTISHSNIAENDSVTLVASNYSRDGYGFAGWSTEQINPDATNAATLINAAASNGKIFGPMETITADSAFLSNAAAANDVLTVTLYAVWIKPVNNATLQNWTGCSTMNQGEVIALKDQRDNNAYAVAKLADGKCWMVENLRLENTNSDNSTGALAQGYGTSATYGNFSGLADPEPTANFNGNDPLTTNSLYSSTADGNKIVIGESNTPYRRMPRYNDDNTQSRASAPTTGTNVNIYSYGNYYSWAAAITNTAYITGGISVSTSLCPAGWRLPGGGNKSYTEVGDNDFWNLTVDGLNNGTGPANYDSETLPYYTSAAEAGPIASKLRGYPNNFIYSGYVNTSSIDNRGSAGYYWTLRAPSVGNGYDLRLGGSSVYPGTGSIGRFRGLSVRCIASTDYAVHFDANGGTGTMGDQTINVNTATALTTNSFAGANDATFAGWNTAADGSGTSYTDGESVTNITTPGKTITLYAQWNVYLYDRIAYVSKGVQTASDLRATITTSNSGIYTYDATTFGAASDAANTSPIYYYRGILDSDLDGTGSTYGSNGNGETWPNYVKLTDSDTGTVTCWRIIRTTGSGGIKMIYNGLYGATTAGSCANALTAAQVGTSAFNSGGKARWFSLGNVGYTYNPDYVSTTATTPTAIGAILGTNANPEVNSADSVMKNYIENTWYENAIGSYTGILEPSAGYCNDRTMYLNGNYTISDILSESTLVKPYDESADPIYRFGAATRSFFSASLQNPTLSCPRNVVDLYTTTTASDGNRQLSKPVALITADELSFVGSGHLGITTASAANSFVRSGSGIWTMSPDDRAVITNEGGNRVRMISNRDNSGGNGPYGYPYSSYASTAYGVRPVISLQAGVIPASGTGTATNPWIIDAPTLEPISCSGANKVCYSPNTTRNDVIGDMSEQSATASTATTLWPTNFKRPGYGFAGWSDKFDWVLNENDANGNGTGANAGYHIYGPMQDITTPSDMSKGLSLYAVWVKSAGTIQDWTCPNNTTMPIGTVTALTDQRDNDTYAVAKLADGNCWMIENLRLDYDANITTSNTQSNNNAFGGVFSGLAEPETANFSNSTTANSLYKSDDSGDIKGTNGATLTDIGTTNYPGYRFPRYNNNNTNPTATTANPNTTVANMTGTGQDIYSYGNYYTWAAVIADTSYYSTNNQSVTNTSICPAGWRLPQGGNKTRIESNDDNDFWNLIVDGLNNGMKPNNYSSSTYPYYTGTDEAGPVAKLARSFPNNLLYSGYFSTASASSRGSNGYYWSSTAGSILGSYRLYLTSSLVSPGADDGTKYSGFSARCIVGS